MRIAIVGGGPAGLMAAETVCAAGAEVDLYDAMASVGRKFLLAGKGGLNLTHAEPLEVFLSRYGSRRKQIEPLIQAFGPEALCDWVHALGIKTFAGTSGRIFPNDMKSAPLLRAWLRRLRAASVQFHVRHRWTGWNEHGALNFTTPRGSIGVRADATILALGGGSWPSLGSDAAWVPFLKERGVALAPLRQSNCGFDVSWSEHIRTKFSGHPVKSVCVMVKNDRGDESWHPGEFVITHTGVEGGVIYAVSAPLRDEIARATVVVVPVTGEPVVSGITVIAMAKMMGKPVIASDNRVVRMHIRSQGDGGYLTQTGNVVLLRALLNVLIESSAERERLAHEARAQAVRALSLKGFVHRMLELQ